MNVKSNVLGRQECDRQFVPSVETALLMLRLWQTAVGNPKKASVTEFRDAWCYGAVGILATLLAGVGQYQVPLKDPYLVCTHQERPHLESA